MLGVRCLFNRVAIDIIVPMVVPDRTQIDFPSSTRLKYPLQYTALPKGVDPDGGVTRKNKEAVSIIKVKIAALERV